MILDNIDQVSTEELAAGVYQILYAGTADRETHQKMRDQRLIPIFSAIVQAKGQPSFAPPNLPKDQTDRVMMSAAYLLGDIAAPDDREAVKALMDMMDDEHDSVKLAAATALGEIAATEATPKIVSFFEQMMTKREVGAIAKLARALAAIGGDDAKAQLSRFTNENRDVADKHVQNAVAEAEAAIKTIDERLA
ncbi:MAG TPA: HEAT repeat domain-containing protein [Pyrinomonadaceae bacterium]|nr:HEAT repeat domain-containing protein [Pyrinomonadaceae bacterium]